MYHSLLLRCRVLVTQRQSPKTDMVFIDGSNHRDIIDMDLVADFCNLIYINDDKEKGLLHLALPSVCFSIKCSRYGELLKVAWSRLLRILFVQQNEVRTPTGVCRSVRACNESIVMLDHVPAGPRAIYGELSGLCVEHCDMHGARF